jgi:hypothetical protein
MGPAKDLKPTRVVASDEIHIEYIRHEGLGGKSAVSKND